jgi:pyruvate kinase
MTSSQYSETPNGHRRARIVCTIGPASNSEIVLRDLIRAGMDVARLNFSHGSHEEHARQIERIRKVAQKEGRSLCIMQDLQGPKIRTGRLKNRIPVALKSGTRVIITPQDILGTAGTIATTFPTLAREVQSGSRILLSDGLIELRVRSIKGSDVECDVINGGLLGEHKGINLPGTTVSVPSLTEKDETDLEFGIKHGVDAIAVSFIRSGDDVRYVRRRLRDHKSDAWIIAKLEKPQAIDHLDDIFDVADGVMVARGDLGVEVPPEKVPILQKHIIQRGAIWRKPVITATKMLESMIENPRPTRAEASDVANAIFDGTDAVMLSAETASGKYPREAVAMMAKIVREAEEHIQSAPHVRRHSPATKLSISETICESIAHAAEDLEMRAICVYTETGNTARLIAAYRPHTTIYAFSYVPAVIDRMNLLWGVKPIMTSHTPAVEDMVRVAEQEMLKRGIVKPSDVIGIVAGTRTITGSTNFMRLHEIGSADDKSAARKHHAKVKHLHRKKPGKKKKK